MVEDADVWLFFLKECSPFFRHLSAFVENMTHDDATACQFNYGLGRNSVLFVIDASEMSLDGRIEQAVGLGNRSDQNGAPPVHGTATG